MQEFSKEIDILLREKYQGIETEDFLHDIQRLNNGEPLDYVIGNIPFLNCKIDLSFKPLIPRTETEFWVEKALKELTDVNKHLNILDLFAGSGCIGVALLNALPNAHVDFGEIDQSLTEQIHINLKLNNVEDRARVIQTDVYSHITEMKYDFIFANPPYLSKERIKDIQGSVLANEPHEALFAEDDGLHYAKTLISDSQSHLNQNGTLFIEIDPHQKEPLETYAKDYNCAITFWNDQYDRTRVAVVTYPKLTM